MKKKPIAPILPIRKRYNLKTGMLPGSIVYTGNKQSESPVIKLIQYNETEFTSYEGKSFSEIVDKFDSNMNVVWINVNGLSDVKLLEEIGAYYHLHALIVEDIANIDHRPKFADFGNHLFLTMEMLRYSEENSQLSDDHFSMILFDKVLLTFQEVENPDLLQISDRLKDDIGKLRSKGPDYLFYSLIDILVDHYYLVVEVVGNQIDSLEDMIYTHSGQFIEQSIQVNKRNLISLRKFIHPMRDELGKISRSESDLLNSKTLKYISDVNEHIVQVAEAVETNREINSGLIDVLDSIVNRRMNQIMKVLTIISTLFIPLTFIVGVYGMNFENLPETRWHYGYFYIWGVMLSIVIFLLVLFKRKGWLD